MTSQESSVSSKVEFKANTHTHRQDDYFTLASRLRVARVMTDRQNDYIYLVEARPTTQCSLYNKDTFIMGHLCIKDR